LKVTFLGTGTSHGVPMIGCDCATCLSDDPRDKRWRPSVFVETGGGDAILIDAGPDLRAQALRFGVRRVDAVVFTHGHADHILGLDEIRRFNALQQRPMPLYGDPATLSDIERMFSYVFDPATPRGGGLPDLQLHRVDGPFRVGARAIVPVPIFHGARPILGFRIGDFAYLTDCSRIPDESWRLLEGLDALVLDALRDRPHPTHYTLDQAVEAATRIAPRRTWFTHMCHDLPHAATCRRLPAGMALAHDGLVVDVGSSQHPILERPTPRS
jgi:phosphoribosyl 1,2-cyclic phosphate phosphodiesterase